MDSKKFADLKFPKDDALLLELAWFQLPDTDNPADAFQPIEEGARLEYGFLEFTPDNLSETTEPHFGKRLIAALEQLPDEMKNDPAYADPVGYVAKVRMGIDPRAPDSERTAFAVYTMTPNGAQLVQHIELTPEQWEAIKAGVGRVTPYGFSVGFTPAEPPETMTINKSVVQLLTKNARALLRRLFGR